MREAVSSDRKAEVVSRWLAGESNEKISASTLLAPPMIVGIINQWKRELGSALADAYRSAASNPDMVGLQQKEEGAVVAAVSPADVVRAFRMMVAFRTLGLEADEAESFITRFYNLNINTGLTPERLANTVKQVLKLAELDGIELHQIPSHVEGLTGLKKQLESELEDLNKRKESIERAIAESIPSKVAEIRQQQENSNHADAMFDNVSREKLSELVIMDRSLEERGLALHDVAEFMKMLDNSKRYGYDIAKIVDLLSNIESIEQTRDELEKELAKLKNKAEILSLNQRAIEDEVSRRQPVINSITKLGEMGFESQDFELIYDKIEKIAEVHGIDYQTAKTIFFQNMQKVDQGELEPEVSEGRRGLVIRNLSEGGEQKIPVVQDHEYSGVLDMLERLKSNGVSEQTIIKCTIINDLFKIDLDSLAGELRKYGSLAETMKRLGDTRKTLESEELLLKHKILALEEQRQRIMTLTRELMKQSPGQIAHLPVQSGTEYGELGALVRAANGEKVNPEELLASLTRAIEMICKTLDNSSITRKIMEHAKLSLKHEPKT
jgi:hypothetical protein